MSATLVDRIVTRCVKNVAQRPGYFTKREVIQEVLARHDLGAILREVRREHVGYGLDECIVGYINNRVGEELQQRDTYGLRVYECYRDAQGTFRWRRLRSMTRKDLDRVLASIGSHLEALTTKQQLYSAFRDALKKPGSMVDEVYESVIIAHGLEAAS